MGQPKERWLAEKFDEIGDFQRKHDLLTYIKISRSIQAGN